MKKKLQLQLAKQFIDRPILYEIVTTYQLKPNIIKADLGEKSTGELIVEIQGTPIDVEKALLYLKEIGVKVREIDA